MRLQVVLIPLGKVKFRWRTIWLNSFECNFSCPSSFCLSALFGHLHQSKVNISKAIFSNKMSQSKSNWPIDIVGPGANMIKSISILFFVVKNNHMTNNTILHIVYENWTTNYKQVTQSTSDPNFSAKMKLNPATILCNLFSDI